MSDHQYDGVQQKAPHSAHSNTSSKLAVFAYELVGSQGCSSHTGRTGNQQRDGWQKRKSRSTSVRVSVLRAVLLILLSVVLVPAGNEVKEARKATFPLSLGQQPAIAVDTSMGEGSDLQIGGVGSGPGQFIHLRDMTFDQSNNLYVLDGLNFDVPTNTWSGNGRVQKFNAAGQYVSQFSLRNEDMGLNGLGTNNTPQRIAVSNNGSIFVTQPKADLVWQFDASGNFVRSIAVPAAFSITTVNASGSTMATLVMMRYTSSTPPAAPSRKSP
jgi:hypothetical protein